MMSFFVFRRALAITTESDERALRRLNVSSVLNGTPVTKHIIITNTLPQQQRVITHSHRHLMQPLAAETCPLADSYLQNRTAAKLHSQRLYVSFQSGVSYDNLPRPV